MANWNWTQQSFKAPDNSGVERGIASILNSVGNVKSQRNLDKLIAETPLLKNRPQLSEENQGIMDHAKRVLGLGPRIGQPQAPVQTQQTMPAQEQPQITPAVQHHTGNQASDITTRMLRKFEGYRDKPYWDVNALRTGYGSDTVTLPDGTVQKVGKDTRVDRAGAERDLSRRVSSEFMPMAAKAVGESWSQLPPEVQGALTSITYNYGRLPSIVASAARTGNRNAIGAAIDTLQSHNGGVNAARRQAEAEIVRSGLIPDSSGAPGYNPMADTPLPNTVQYQPAGLQGAPQQAAPNIDPAVLMGIMRSDSAPPAMKQWAAQFMPQPAQPTSPMKVGANETVIDPRTGQVIYQGQGSPETTTGIREYEYARSQGFNGSFADYQQQKAKAGATNVNVGGAQGEYGKETDKSDSKEFSSLRQAGFAAQRSNATLSHMSKLLEDPNVYQGTGGGIVAKAKGLFNAFGVETEGLSNTQAFNALGNKIALELRNPAGGAGMPGSLSDKDREFLVSMTPNLENTPEGNKLLIEYMTRVNNRQIQITKLAREYAKQNGGRYDYGFDDVLEKWDAANPLFTEEDYQRAQSIRPAAPQQQTNTPQYSGGYAATSQQQGNAATVQRQEAQPVQITSEAQYRSLRPGTVYLAPDGTQRTKP